MPLKSYLIAPFESGLQTNLQPWLIPEDAFEDLENAYVWRGRVRKKYGTQYLGANELSTRLRVNVGTTDGSGNITATVPGTSFSVGQNFSIGTEVFTVVVAGTSGTMLASGSATLHTFDTSTGEVIIEGADATTSLYYYPSLPVMGLRTRENSNFNFELTVGFDPQFSYLRQGGAWERLDSSTSWSGTNSNFFWTTNYRGSDPYVTSLYAVNYVAADNIKYIPEGSSSWTNLRPQLDSGGTRFLETCLIIVGFKDRLVCLNTIEDTSSNDQNYVNRARWSQNGNPVDASGGWLDDTPGKGGYIDASTKEAIISCEFIKDQLIVYFERSTWELAYTGNSTLPFRWQQLNSELGVESTFSIIGFDKAAVGVGNVGIHTCNGVNVSRIDEKIPDLVFQIHNGNNGLQRVYGIRDYYRELVYWTLPDSASDPTFPTRVLVWNYRTGSWAINRDSITCFGYLQKDADLTWATVGDKFPTWESWNQSWNSGQAQSQFPFIIGGNQEGYTFILNADFSFNQATLSVTAMTTASQRLTIYNHNLSSGDFVKIYNANGVTLFQDEDGNDVTIFKIAVVDADTISVDNITAGSDKFGWTGTYTGGGSISRVSNLNITSKQWNPGTPIGQQFRLPYLDFLLDNSVNGEVSVDYLIDFTSGDAIQDQTPEDYLLGTNVLYTKPEENSTYQVNQKRIWHRYFLMTQGQTIQIKMFMSDEQMRDDNISSSDFQLNAIIIYAEPQGRIVG